MARQHAERQPAVVRAEGLEPPRLASPEPKSGASASSATPARRPGRHSQPKRAATPALWVGGTIYRAMSHKINAELASWAPDPPGLARFAQGALRPQMSDTERPAPRVAYCLPEAAWFSLSASQP